MNNKDISDIFKKYIEVLTEANTRPDYIGGKVAKGALGFKGANVHIPTGSSYESERRHAGKSHLITPEEINLSKLEYLDRVQENYQTGLYLDFNGKLTKQLEQINRGIKLYNSEFGENIPTIKETKFKKIKLDFSEFTRPNDFNVFYSLLENKSILEFIPSLGDPSEFSTASLISLPQTLDSLNALKESSLLPHFLKLVDFVSDPNVWDAIYEKSAITLDAREGKSVVKRMSDPEIKDEFISRLNYVKDSRDYFDNQSEIEYQTLVGKRDITLGKKLIPYFSATEVRRVEKNRERGVSYAAKQDPTQQVPDTLRGNIEPKVPVTGEKEVSSRANPRPSTSQKNLKSIKSAQLRRLQELQDQLKTAKGAERFKIAAEIGKLKEQLGQ